MRYPLLVVVALLTLGCTSEPPHERIDAAADQAQDSKLPGCKERLSDALSDTSFGIANTFSGNLSKGQERTVPESLRGAFMIESLRTITAAALAEKLQFRILVAEEVRDGVRHVALKDLRCVQFSDDVSGQMIVIERYRVVPE